MNNSRNPHAIVCNKEDMFEIADRIYNRISDSNAFIKTQIRERSRNKTKEDFPIEGDINIMGKKENPLTKNSKVKINTIKLK